MSISDFSRVNMPHICQYDPAIPCLKDKNETNKPGLTFCAPVTAAKTLIGRAKADPKFQMLVPSQGSDSEELYRSRLINQLALDMGTSCDLNDPNVGTTPKQYIDGLEKFLVDRNFRYSADSKWHGWGAGEIDSKRKSDPISKQDLRVDLANPNKDLSCHIGWYQDAKNGIWFRKGGHFVAGKGIRNNGIVSIEDPSPRSEGKTTEIKPEEISEGVLNNGEKDQTGAQGYMMLHGMKAKVADSKPTTGILDGVFSFGIERS